MDGALHCRWAMIRTSLQNQHKTFWVYGKFGVNVKALINFTILCSKFCDEFDQIYKQWNEKLFGKCWIAWHLIFPASCTDAAAIFCGGHCIVEPQWLPADAEDTAANTWTARFCAWRAAPQQKPHCCSSLPQEETRLYPQPGVWNWKTGE